ncbi:FAD-dependent oxidoreductase [Halovenus salina]|uniref:FAD-dependent oxidoreductase n=1 Tax=Halovenus salina TaxID=1510225 RepID=A0ABD5VV06_9EURY|nr:FAD-dependent oxidoreductase [Halovenus salina]
MARSEAYEVIVVGGGIGGCFAAATAAANGAEVVQLERKPADQGGFIACGDAIKSPTDPKGYPGPIDMAGITSDEAVLANGNIDKIEWWDEELGVRKVLPYDSHSNVIDRYEFGQRLLEQTGDLGVTQHFNTVVNGIIQNGQVQGVEAIRDGEPVEYTGEMVIDGAGAQSVIQDMVAFEELAVEPESTFEKPHYTHFGSAYREIIETDEPVDYKNAIVGKPLEEMGYVWYFPRSPTSINVGLGFQMNKEPIALADRLREDVEDRPEFENASIADRFDKKNKLGAALALRRPLDSMVAPGYITVGCAAGTTHPITGKGIRGAAFSGYSAGKTAAAAVADGDVSEQRLWEHNHYLYVEHGEASKLAARDAYNVAASSIDIPVLRAVAAILPEDEIREIVSTKTSFDDLASKLSIAAGATKNLISHYRKGTFDHLGVSKEMLYEALMGFRTTREFVDRYEEHYENYPASREGYFEWLTERDRIDDEFYDAIDLEPEARKYQ